MPPGSPTGWPAGWSAEAEGAGGYPFLAQSHPPWPGTDHHGGVFHATSRQKIHFSGSWPSITSIMMRAASGVAFTGTLLPVEVFDEIGTGVDGDLGGATDQRLFLQLAGLDDRTSEYLGAAHRLYRL